jgi:hypothetical protein
MLRILRRALPFLTVALLAFVAYDAWIFYSRWRDRQEAEGARAKKESEDARRIIDQLGGGQLKILNFYASPGAIHHGEAARLCYGVFGATTVRLDPPVGEVYPSVAHCVDVSPASSTKYTLTAGDGKGHSTSQQVRVEVR